VYEPVGHAIFVLPGHVFFRLILPLPRDLHLKRLLLAAAHSELFDLGWNLVVEKFHDFLYDASHLLHLLPQDARGCVRRPHLRHDRIPLLRRRLHLRQVLLSLRPLLLASA